MALSWDDVGRQVQASGSDGAVELVGRLDGFAGLGYCRLVDAAGHSHTVPSWRVALTGRELDTTGDSAAEQRLASYAELSRKLSERQRATGRVPYGWQSVELPEATVWMQADDVADEPGEGIDLAAGHNGE